VERGCVKCCRLIPLGQTSIEETYRDLSALFSTVAAGIEEVGEAATSDLLWDHLKKRLLNAGYKLYIQNAPRAVEDAVRQLTTFVET
jgi:hypothetical protein